MAFIQIFLEVKSLYHSQLCLRADLIAIIFEKHLAKSFGIVIILEEI